MIKQFNEFLNEQEGSSKSDWSAMGPYWLYNYVLGQKGSADAVTYRQGAKLVSYITMEHVDYDEPAKPDSQPGLDITVIFFLLNGKIRWNWTWGDEKKDIESMIDYEIEHNEREAFGDTPKEFVEDVMNQITKIEKKDK
jgi:hypothetical protein